MDTGTSKNDGSCPLTLGIKGKHPLRMSRLVIRMAAVFSNVVVERRDKGDGKGCMDEENN